MNWTWWILHSWLTFTQTTAAARPYQEMPQKTWFSLHGRRVEQLYEVVFPENTLKNMCFAFTRKLLNSSMSKYDTSKQDTSRRILHATYNSQPTAWLICTPPSMTLFFRPGYQITSSEITMGQSAFVLSIASWFLVDCPLLPTPVTKCQNLKRLLSSRTI